MFPGGLDTLDALEQAFFNSLNTTHILNLLLLLCTHTNVDAYVHGVKKKPCKCLCFQVSLLPLSLLCFSLLFCLLPVYAVARELQENIRGQRQQPATQYSCTGRDERFYFTMHEFVCHTYWPVWLLKVLHCSWIGNVQLKLHSITDIRDINEVLSSQSKRISLRKPCWFKRSENLHQLSCGYRIMLQVTY